MKTRKLLPPYEETAQRRYWDGMRMWAMGLAQVGLATQLVFDGAEQAKRLHLWSIGFVDGEIEAMARRAVGERLGYEVPR